MVRHYEDFIDSLRGHPGLASEEVQKLVQERRRALQEAISSGSNRTLTDILGPAGFERFTSSPANESSAEVNQRTFQRLKASSSFPVALLYHLFNDPPDFLKRSLPLLQENLPPLPDSTLNAREQTFIHWLEDSARNAPEGWLTLETINRLNNVMSQSNKLFHPGKGQSVSPESIRYLLSKIRKHTKYATAIETRPRIGKAWRLNRWTST
jgi:hypothetical protein